MTKKTPNLRLRHRADVCLMLQALTADGTPVTVAALADRLGMVRTVVSHALADLEVLTPGPQGPLPVNGGWVWVD